jgi:predicted RNA-binding protein YlxR (DUF448 family)
LAAVKERTCIVTRTVRPRDELIRFVRDPDGGVVPDLKGVLPGRGVWVTARADLVAKAVERKLFARAFRGEARADMDLVDMVGDLLLRRALDFLGMARRAGQAVSGFFKVEELIGEGRAGVLIEACDGAEDGRRKLRNRFLAALSEAGIDAGGMNRVVSCFTIEQLSLALGRTNVVHAALIKGRLGEEFLAVARRHEAYRA